MRLSRAFLPCPRRESNLNLPLRRRLWRRSRTRLYLAVFEAFAALFGPVRLVRIRPDMAGCGGVWAANRLTAPWIFARGFRRAGCDFLQVASRSGEDASPSRGDHEASTLWVASRSRPIGHVWGGFNR